MRNFLLGFVMVLTCGASLAGAWGPGSFDNDDALDWVTQCTGTKSGALIASTLQVILKPGQIDASDGTAAVAAAEVVAAAKGRPNKSLPPELRVWVNAQAKAELAKLAPDARKALLRLQEPDVSELAQFWNDSPTDQKKWRAAIVDLERRLR